MCVLKTYSSERACKWFKIPGYRAELLSEGLWPRCPCLRVMKERLASLVSREPGLVSADTPAGDASIREASWVLSPCGMKAGGMLVMGEITKKAEKSKRKCLVSRVPGRKRSAGVSNGRVVCSLLRHRRGLCVPFTPELPDPGWARGSSPGCVAGPACHQARGRCERAPKPSSSPDPRLALQISIVELEKSQRQQELLQLKSCVPPDEALSAHLRGKGALGRELEADPSRLHLDLDCSKFSLPHFSSASPELSMNGHAANYELCSALSRPSSKQNTPQYLASPLDQEVVPCTPSHSSRSRLEKMSGLALPDYTRLSPAKLVLRRHLSQDHATSGKPAASELHPR